jgi:hypothetical protein
MRRLSNLLHTYFVFFLHYIVSLPSSSRKLNNDHDSIFRDRSLEP